MAAQIKYIKAEVTDIECCECGLRFSVPTAWERNRREKHDNFWCPNGHSLSFPSESRAEKAERELAAAKAQHKTELEWERHRREAAERSAAAHKGKVTGIKNRIGNGVCPCCKRSFQNLKRHMCTKHPDFKDGAEP